MKSTKQLLGTVSLLAATSVLVATSSAQADPVDLESLLGPTLYEQSIFANTYVSTGASSTISGSIQTGTYLTTGDSAMIAGDTLAVGATTLGASSAVSGNLQSGTAVTFGASAQVIGTVQYGSDVTNGAGSTSGTQTQNTTAPVIAAEQQGVVDAQETLDAMTPDLVLASGNIATDITFTPGVYDVAGLLTVTANKTITLDAQGQDSEFIFNIGNYLTFGAGVNIVVENGTDNTRVIWNATGNYVSIGASANIIGTILAKEYVSTGADSTVSGAGDACGAVYSATSYVSVGAGAIVGSGGSCGAAVPPEEEDYSCQDDPECTDVPEEEDYSCHNDPECTDAPHGYSDYTRDDYFDYAIAFRPKKDFRTLGAVWRRVLTSASFGRF
jgi:hypothetical protein